MDRKQIRELRKVGQVWYFNILLQLVFAAVFLTFGKSAGEDAVAEDNLGYCLLEEWEL